MLKIIGMVLVLYVYAVSPLLAREPAPVPDSNNSKSIKNITTFLSDNGEILTVSYDMQDGNVTLTLPDGATVRLPRAISGSGTRYANDRMVYWEHQGEASVWIGEKLIFKGAIAPKIP